MSQSLIIVDLQKDYFPGGRMELAGTDAAARNARLALDLFRERGLPVFHIRHVSVREGTTFFLPGTAGVEIHELVAPADGEAVIEKHFPNSFRDTELDDRLQERDITDVTICGAMTHMCIDTTVRAAFDFGYRCTLLADGCATRDLAFGGTAVSAEQVQAAYLAALANPFARVIASKELSV